MSETPAHDFHDLAAARDEIARLRAEKARHERWFKTLDAQVRVLDRERQKFVALVNQSDTFVCVVDPQKTIQWMNQAMQLQMESNRPGFAPQKELCEAFEILNLELVLENGAQCPIERSFATGQVVHAELRFVRVGDHRDFYLTGVPILGPLGTPAEVMVLIQDLTDLAVLRRSESRYRLLFERSPDALVMVDPQTERILLANPVASRLTGWTLEELTRLSLEELHVAEGWPQVREELHAFGSGAEAKSLECQIVSKLGERVSVLFSLARFDFEGREVALVDYQDISERLRLEGELRQSHKMEAIGRLAGGVAHDFNNLLTVVMGHTEQLSKQYAHDRAMCNSLDVIQKAAVRGSLLTRQLLAFGRKEVVQAIEHDVNDILLELGDLLRRLIGEDIVLETHLAPEDAFVKIDRGQLEQVIMNLATNARDAMPQGGLLQLKLSVETNEPAFGTAIGTAAPDTLLAEERVVRITVRDTGFGMDRATLAHVFEPFFTTKERGKGTGLGLSTAYAIVKEYGGTIDVESSPGKGTTFTIEFPWKTAPPQVSAKLVEETPAASAPTLDAAAVQETILLVEDEHELRKLAAMALELASYSVIEASCGEEALEICSNPECEIDLLLTDVIMPGMGGGELVKRATRVRPGLRILYMSGYTDDSIVRHGVSGSEAAFLQKPFTLDALSKKVREVLDPGK